VTPPAATAAAAAPPPPPVTTVVVPLVTTTTITNTRLIELQLHAMLNIAINSNSIECIAVVTLAQGNFAISLFHTSTAHAVIIIIMLPIKP
jgi:hypothetical protein